MPSIAIEDLHAEFLRVLLANGLESAKANKLAGYFTDNTRDGVLSHGINRFPSFITAIQSGLVNIATEATCTASLGAIERWNGQQGIGLLNAESCMARAIELAHEHGIGAIALQNTNHWMRGGSYGLQATEAGCTGICWTNTQALMPQHGQTHASLGNNPLVIAIPTSTGPLLLDMAMSQFSAGKLDIHAHAQTPLPVPGGYDQSGQLTTDALAIQASNRPLPIGFWKGAGLAFMLDMLAAALSGGDSTATISTRAQETSVSQCFIAIAMDQDTRTHTDAVFKTWLAAHPDSQHYPGAGMLAARQKSQEQGITVTPSAWQQLKNL